MTATLQDLRDTLAEAAEQSFAPSGPDILASVERGVAGARRRTVARVCALAVAAVGIAGAVTVGAGRKDAATPSGPPASGSLRVVADDPTFAAFDRGLRRIAVVEVPLGAAGSVDLSALERPDRRVYAWRYCTGTGADGRHPSLRLVSGSRVRYLDCPPRAEATAGMATALWFPADAGHEVVASASAGTTKGGMARIAFYQDASRDQYPLPQRPADLATNPDYAWDQPPGTVAFVGPADPSSPNVPRTITVPYRERLGVTVQVRGPGSVTLELNGTGMNLGCWDPGRIGQCVPQQLLGDTLTTWGYGFAAAGRYLDNDGLQVGEPLTVTVHPSQFLGDDWRVLVDVREQ